MDNEKNDDIENPSLARILEKLENDDIENPSLARILEKLVEASQKKEGKNLKHIADKLIVEKFNSKTSNAHQWIVTYEKECTRLQNIKCSSVDSYI
ncbi:hypothetical protein QE152_g6105 [Popillia japonica]|uniref:Uncharacterized protein n=1 Tax=Popillia japonica TaxID=7064 RepID=A0AAW1MKB1_POPJA